MSKIEIYSDGAFSPNKNRGGLGLIFVIDGKKVYEYGRTIVNTTNNKCELLGVIIALNSISKPVESITIYSDSQYVIGTINNNWKRHKNINYWKLFDEKLIKAKTFCNNIKFVWVKGHNDDLYNEQADRLAVFYSQVYETKKES